MQSKKKDQVKNKVRGRGIQKLEKTRSSSPRERRNRNCSALVRRGFQDAASWAQLLLRGRRVIQPTSQRELESSRNYTAEIFASRPERSQ